MRNNLFTEDSKIDLVYPAQQSSFVIDSDGSLINGFIEIAQGKGPHPLVLLLHGFPGTEKNGDIAHIIRRAGFNVVVFSYRGSWGSKGSYSFKNCIDDVNNVINYFQSNPEKFRTNGDQIILIGYSLGGFLALYSAYMNESIKNVASISGWCLNFTKKYLKTDEQHRDAIYDLINNSMNPLDGTTPEALIQEINDIDSWNFDNFYDILRTKNICLIASLKDEIVPAEYYHFPIINELEKSNSKTKIKLTQKTFYDAFHSYSDHRIKLTKTLLEWLSEQK